MKLDPDLAGECPHCGEIAFKDGQGNLVHVCKR